MSDEDKMTPEQIDDFTRIMAKYLYKTNGTAVANDKEYIGQLVNFTYIFINEPGMKDKEDDFIDAMIQTKKDNPGMSLENIKTEVVQKLLHSGGKSKKSKKSKKLRKLRKSKKSKKSRKQRRTRRF
jgi:hypothetical protein